jgi:hypothetical protein
MWKDMATMLAFWVMVLAPCMVTINSGRWGTEDDGGYERGTRRPRPYLGKPYLGK